MITKHTYVGGQPRPSGLETFDKLYPATGEVIAKIEPTSLEQLDEVIAEAAEAQKAWAALSGTERGRVLLRAAKILQDRNEALSRVEVMDVGKAIAEAESGDVPSGPDALEYFGGIARDMPGTFHTYPGAVGPCPHELDAEPAIAEAGILEQRVHVRVAEVRAAHLLEEVAVSVVVEVGPRARVVP